MAEAADDVSITEISEMGSVSSLRVSNGADRPVLLLDGEELIGAKQNRVLNTTVLVAAHATVIIPVSCVERGRWAYRGRRLASGEVTLFASLRGKNAARVSASLREHRVHLGDQRGIWDDLAARADAHRVADSTGRMHAVYERYADEVTEVCAAIGAKPGQVGCVVYLAGEWVGLEVLAAPGLFARAWRQLCAGYAADAIGLDTTNDLATPPAEVLRMVALTPTEPAPSISLGHEYRLTSCFVSGAALVVDQTIAHLMAFPASIPGERVALGA